MNKAGFHRIEVETTPDRWFAICAGDYWFGNDYLDSNQDALKKAENRLNDRRYIDSMRKYRLITKYKDHKDDEYFA